MTVDPSFCYSLPGSSSLAHPIWEKSIWLFKLHNQHCTQWKCIVANSRIYRHNHCNCSIKTAMFTKIYSCNRCVNQAVRMSYWSLSVSFSGYFAWYTLCCFQKAAVHRLFFRIGRQTYKCDRQILFCCFHGVAVYWLSICIGRQHCRLDHQRVDEA